MVWGLNLKPLVTFDMRSQSIGLDRTRIRSVCWLAKTILIGTIHSEVSIRIHSEVSIRMHSEVSIRIHSEVSIRIHSEVSIRIHSEVSIRMHSEVSIRMHSEVSIRIHYTCVRVTYAIHVTRWTYVRDQSEPQHAGLHVCD